MTDTTRRHDRLPTLEPAGARFDLSLGRLFIPARSAKKQRLPLIVHFHGGFEVPEQSVTRSGHAVLAIQIGAGSGVYTRAFTDPERLTQLLEEAARLSRRQFTSVTLSSFSAGYGAIRAILRHAPNRERVSGVMLADSLHAGYGSEPQDLDCFLELATSARTGRLAFLVTHSEVYPGTYASTTETADRLLSAASLRRKAVLKWGPLGMQQLSEARVGRFEMLGFAGNSAPDHVDHLHALAWWWKRLKLPRR